MTKALAIILVLLMAFSLFACQQTDSNSDTSPSTTVSPAADTTSETSASQTEPSMSASATAPTSPESPKKLTGFYEESYDYSKNPTYKIVYMTASASMLTQVFSDSFKLWSTKMNMEYFDWAGGGDNDLFASTLETFIAQGYDGFLLDPDVTIYSRIIDIVNENQVHWMPVMGPATDDDGKLVHPYIGADNIAYGVGMADWLIDYAKKTWPDAKNSEIAMLSLDYSVVPLIHERTLGEQSVWEKEYSDVATTNFIVADGVTLGKLDAETGYNIAAPILSANPQIKYWLIAAAFDDYAQGAALAAKDMGKENTTAATACGGTILISQWDAGNDSCWLSALYTPQVIFSEAIIGGLYSFMSGQATPETLWPEWVNHGSGESYANLLITPFLVTKEEYQEEMEFVDVFTGTDTSNYPYNGTIYPIIGDPPASYNG